MANYIGMTYQTIPWCGSLALLCGSLASGKALRAVPYFWDFVNTLCFCCTVGILYTCTSASLLVFCLFCLISLIPCRISLHLYNGLFPRYCLFGCRDSLHFHHFCPSFLWSFSLPVLPQCRVCIFFWLLEPVCRQSYHYHVHLAHGVHI